MNPRVIAIHKFWFPEGMKFPNPKWFQKDINFDKEIKENFEVDLVDLGQGKLDSWLEGSPVDILSYIILSDQFSRNMYRGDPKSFAFDSFALKAAKLAVAKGLDKDLSPKYEATFIYMPFMHSENKEDQQKCVELFEKLAEEVPEVEKKVILNNLNFALRHQKIVNEFGRFPHRNKILGRQSTKEEEEFLKTEGSSF